MDAKPIGKVVHYYDKIGVAIIELKSPLKKGVTVKFQKGDKTDFEQAIDSMQVNHEVVEAAKKGDQIGVKVDQKVPEGTMVLAASSK